MKKLLIVSAVALALVASITTKANAATVAELQAQIAQLTSMLAALSGGTTSASAGYTFNTNLTVGSKGADVEALQTWLASKGFLSIPAGTSKGYFGQLTKGAVVAYQVSAGLPATGFVGPMTRGKLNSVVTTTTTTTTTTTGTTPTPAPSTGITTPGAEGTLTVTTGPVSGSTAYENDSMYPVIAFKAEAKNSDIALQRVKLDLGTNSKIYNKIYKKLYITNEDGQVLASQDLNSSTVVKEGSTYYITMTGFSYVIPKGSTKTLTIKADVYASIDSGDLTSYSLSLTSNGVRGVDGAGIDQYSPSSSFSRSTTISGDLTDSASLTVSTDPSTPKASDVVASEGSAENEFDKQSVLVFKVEAKKDKVTVTDMNVAVVKTGSGAATVATAYLYDGSTLVDSASITSGVAVFDNIDYTISKDSTKTFTVKVDIRSANGTSATFTATASSTGMTAENSRGDSITGTYLSGSATGEAQVVRNIGPVFVLESMPSIVRSGSNQTGSTLSTSTLAATFNVRIKAVGGPIYFGLGASSTPAFGTSTNYFKVYQNGTAATLVHASSTSYSAPTNTVTTGIGASSFKLEEGNEVTVPVTFTIDGKTIAGATPSSSNSYAIALEGVSWSADGGATSNLSNFMAGKTEWRSTSSSF